MRSDDHATGRGPHEHQDRSGVRRSYCSDRDAQCTSLFTMTCVQASRPPRRDDSSPRPGAPASPQPLSAASPPWTSTPTRPVRHAAPQCAPPSSPARWQQDPHRASRRGAHS
eukprot:7134999-Prymnesium_polylepis.2